MAAGSHCGSLRSVALASAMACLAWSGLAVLPTAHAQSASSHTAMSTSHSLSVPAQPWDRH